MDLLLFVVTCPTVGVRNEKLEFRWSFALIWWKNRWKSSAIFGKPGKNLDHHFNDNLWILPSHLLLKLSFVSFQEAFSIKLNTQFFMRLLNREFNCWPVTSGFPGNLGLFLCRWAWTSWSFMGTCTSFKRKIWKILKIQMSFPQFNKSLEKLLKNSTRCEIVWKFKMKF